MLRRGAQVAWIACAVCGAASAQNVISAKAGLVYFVQGHVLTDESGALKSGETLSQLNQGDTLFTEHGRAEILLNPGTVLRIGEMSRIRMDRVDLTDTRVALEEGSAVVTVDRPAKLDHVEFEVAGAAVVLKSSGEYRLDARNAAETPRLRVYSGKVEVDRGDGGLPLKVKSGREVQLPGSGAGKFDRDDADALEVWAEARALAAEEAIRPPRAFGFPNMPGPSPRPRRAILDAFFGSENARTPAELVRFVNEHVAYEWEAMGKTEGPAGDVLDACAEPKPDCSAKLVDVPDLREQIVALRNGVTPPAFLLYRRETTNTWEYAGAYGVGEHLEPNYQVLQRGGKRYFAVTRSGLTDSGVDVETEDWIDLAGAKFGPAFSLVTSSRFSDQREYAAREYETTASIVSWQCSPVETVEVEYRASAGASGSAKRSTTAAATFVRQGETFVFDPLRSTVPQRARWGAFDVDGRRLLLP